MKDLLLQARQLKDWGVKHRRYLHQHPELSLQEVKTAQYCADVLAALGYEIRPSWGHGFTADLTVAAASKTIALRAEMDALPIQEKNTHDFVSKYSHVAHMCGHDSHMSIALTAAKLLMAQKNQLRCSVRFLFQPSEEKPPGGALGMIQQGCLEGVDEVYGLHNDPGTPVGHVRLRSGPLMAAADAFWLEIIGRGCHAAKPHEGLDPICPAAQLIMEWQALVARYMNPVHPAVLSVTQVQAGDTFNVIPDHAKLAGTVRTFFEQDRDLIQCRMQQSVDAVVARGYRCQFNYVKGYDAVINHAPEVAHVAQVATAILGEKQVDVNTDPEGWGEDFAYYLQHRPGAFFFLGSGDVDAGICAPLHSPHFDINEEALTYGAAIMAGLALEHLSF